ncbi:MAG: isopentenyl phosphate kinase, partial [Chloroflexota bacterium]
KLGGSLLTDKNQNATARINHIRQCARAIADAMRARPDLRLLLAHGSGSFGHFAATQSRFGSSGVTGYAATGAAAARLNRIVTDICLDEGLPVVSMQPSASAVCDDGRLVEMATRPIALALQHSLMPVVFGDVAFDLTRGETIASTELIFGYLAQRLAPSRIVLAGQVNGVFTADPLRDPLAQRIARITPATFERVHAQLGGSHGVDVTGGMLSKVELMVNVVRALPTVRVQIVSGETSGLLARVLCDADDDVGTWIENDKETGTQVHTYTG